MALRRLPTSLAATVAAAAALTWLAAAALALTFPTLTGRVVDEAAILSPEVEASLTAKLAALEDQTSNQVVVVTLNSLQGTDIADYGYQLGRHWGIGQAGKDNGLLLIVAPNERQVRFEVGYGLEPMLTDAVARLIIENAVLPRFRAGDFAGGIERGVDDAIQVLTGGAEEFQERAAQRPERPLADPVSGALVFFVVLVIFIILIALMARGGGGPGLPIGSGRSGWSGRRSSGGFSGASGGFRGGGGSFGGGGASGRW